MGGKGGEDNKQTQVPIFKIIYSPHTSTQKLGLHCNAVFVLPQITCILWKTSSLIPKCISWEVSIIKLLIFKNYFLVPFVFRDNSFEGWISWPLPCEWLPRSVWFGCPSDSKCAAERFWEQLWKEEQHYYWYRNYRLGRLFLIWCHLDVLDLTSVELWKRLIYRKCIPGTSIGMIYGLWY